MSSPPNALTLGELKASGYATKPVKEEIRHNLILKLSRAEPLFPGVVGFENTVVPQIINAIQELNRSARRDWLDAFAIPALRRYLDHLEVTLEPRGRGSVWVRSGETPAIVTRTPSW